MTTKFEADVAAAYKALDERVEIICLVATRLLAELEHCQMETRSGHWILMSVGLDRLIAELRSVIK